MTKYLVFRKIEESSLNIESPSWAPSGEMNASSSEEAVRKFLAAEMENGSVDGEYVAVPERSFRPVKVAVQQKLSLTT